MQGGNPKFEARSYRHCLRSLRCQKNHQSPYSLPPLSHYFYQTIVTTWNKKYVRKDMHPSRFAIMQATLKHHMNNLFFWRCLLFFTNLREICNTQLTATRFYFFSMQQSCTNQISNLVVQKQHLPLSKNTSQVNALPDTWLFVIAGDA